MMDRDPDDLFAENELSDSEDEELDTEEVGDSEEEEGLV